MRFSNATISAATLLGMFASTNMRAATFKWCGQEVSLAAAIWSSDQNLGAAHYEFAFAEDEELKKPIKTVVFDKIPGRSAETLSAHREFRYDQTYWVSVRSRNEGSWSEWSKPCSFKTAHKLQFLHCGKQVSLAAGATATDGNQTATGYQFEFVATNQLPIIIETGKGVGPELYTRAVLVYDRPYQVRVRVKQPNNADWSAYGAPCTFTPSNTFRLERCSKGVLSIDSAITTEQHGFSGAAYRYEFSTSSDFANPTVVELPGGRQKAPAPQQPPMRAYPSLRDGGVYYVRVLVKQSDDDSWSKAGPTCVIGISSCLKP